jgi:Ca2+-binding EF-hand superfamily protein
MHNYDYDSSGTILTTDLVRVFKRLGILHPEPHLPTLIKAGGARETDDRIDYVIYSQNLHKSIEKALGLNIKKTHEHLQKIYAVLQAKKMSIFEFFCTLDVNMSGSLSKLELKTGAQSQGLTLPTNEFESLWKMIKKPVKKLNLKELDE